MSQQLIAELFLGIVVVYAALIAFMAWRYSKSGLNAAQENFPKTVKHISQSFVAITVFLLMFYLAIAGLIPKDVLITLISVFATAGLLILNEK